MTTLDDPVPGGRRLHVQRAGKLAADLTGVGVQGIALTYVDTAGITRVKAVPVVRLKSATSWGVGMSPVFDTFLADDSIVATDVLGGPDGDLRLFPDLDALVTLAGQPGWAWAPVDRITQEGTTHPACTRTLLRHVVRDAEAAGLTFRAAIEIEWALGRDDVPAGEFVPAVNGPAYGMTRLVEQSEFSADLLKALGAEGVDVDQLHPEYAAGQFEVSVGALNPVAAADRSVLVRQTIRAVAARHGLRVSFAPSVVAGGVGNGGHVHLSPWQADANLMSGGDGRYGLTAGGEAFAAGVLAELPALAVLATPSPSSFLRLQPSHWAGVYQCWGRENREAALRLVTGMTGNTARAANLEVKVADLAANPYLLLAGLIAAGRAGMERAATLPDEVPRDPAALDEVELERLGAHRLPVTMDAALAAFGRSDLLRRTLGDVLADAVVAVRQGEADRTAGMGPEETAAAYRWVY